jgi:hypothetical protein
MFSGSRQHASFSAWLQKPDPYTEELLVQQPAFELLPALSY